MKKQLSSDNPFAGAVHELHWAYGLEFIRDGVTLLDYGCFDGAFLRALVKTRNVTAIGADKNRDIIAAQDDVQIVYVDKGIPFPDGSFDVVTLFDVLEHIHDQRSLLAEIRRVLRSEGLLIVSVPRRNLLSFMDWGNYKYVFPGIHRRWYVRKHGSDAYEYRYVNNPNGLIGDVEKEKAWHQHFRRRDLSALLRASGYSIRDVDGTGLFTALLVNLGFARIRFPISLWRWQAKKFDRERLFCVAVKRGVVPEGGSSL